MFISFVPQQIEVTTLCLSVCTGQTEAENYILSPTFLESKWSCWLSQVLTYIRIQSIISKGLQYFIMSTLLYLRKPHFHKLIIICLRENGCFCSEDFAIEEVIVDEGVCCALPLSTVRLLCLCTAGRLKRVPHESGSGTAALSGDKVIRTGNNERERKS